jgi:NADH-quinone oxidoreductase subunit J
MFPHATIGEWIIGAALLLSALGVVLLRRPIYASLSFLLSLLALAAFYLRLSAEFIAVMQVLVYAGAILVIFIFVIVLFQDAHEQLKKFASNSRLELLAVAAAAFAAALGFFAIQSTGILPLPEKLLPEGFGSVQSIGQALYLDFFFPFEAVILLFLVAVIGALYMAKREG